METRLGRTIMSYRGIKYAETPEGLLRFQPPVPVQNSSGLKFATKDGPVCPQPKNSFTSEDCLTVSVYTPDISCNREKSDLMPVIAYIGGTGLMFGGSDSSKEGPEYLLDHDVVLVTINYRLGSLGFLSTGVVKMPGHMGYKDQVLALRWIRDNIEKFGGNPNMVTLMGWSAGAMSAMLHMVSPMSEGLFHRAIIMSGSVPPQMPMPYNTLDVLVKQAALMGCYDFFNDTKVQCLRKKDAKKIGRTSARLRSYGMSPWYVWYPVIEPDFGKEVFVAKKPNISFVEGNFIKVPVMIGSVQHEFYDLAQFVVENEKRLKLWQAKENFSSIAQTCFMFDNTTNASDALWEKFVSGKSGDELFENIGRLFSDAIVKFGMHQFVTSASKFTNVYYYEYTYKNRQEKLKRVDLKNYVLHGDDKVFLLKDSNFSIAMSGSEADHQEKMLDLWISFAKTGNPNILGESFKKLNITWLPYSISKSMLELGKNFQMKKFDETFYETWKNIFL